MNKKSIDENYEIENFEDYYEELRNIKNDMSKHDLKLVDAINNVKRAKELYCYLSVILDEAKKEVREMIDTGEEESNIMNESKDEAINFDSNEYDDFYYTDVDMPL